MNNRLFFAAAAQFQQVPVYTMLWVMRHKANGKGLCPISCRVTINGKRTEVSTQRRILPEKWDNSTHSVKGNTKSSAMLNEQLQLFVAHVYELVNMMKAHGRKVTARTLRQAMDSPFVPDSPCFVRLVEQQLASYARTARVATLEQRKYAVDLLRKWVGPDTDLPLETFTPTRAAIFYDWLLTDGNRKATTVNSIISSLTALFNRAAEAELADVGQNPFRVLRRKKNEKVTRLRLTKAQITQLREVPLIDSEAEARDVYLTQYYLHGSRAGAVLKLRWQDIGADAVTLRVEKGGAEKTIRITPELRQILERRRTQGSGPLLFSFLPGNFHALTEADQFKARHRAISSLNGYLRTVGTAVGLPSGLHSHTARHTLASHAAEVAGVRVAQVMLGHTNIQMTERYIGQMRDEVLMSAEASIYGVCLPAPEPSAPAPGFEFPAEEEETRVIQFRFGA